MTRIQMRHTIDRLTKILEDALRQSGCDGDLCLYQWHEDARSVLSDIAAMASNEATLKDVEVLGDGSKQSIDLIGPNDNESEPSFKNPYICFSRLPDGIHLCVSDNDTEVSVKPNYRDLQLLQIYTGQAMRPIPQMYATLTHEKPIAGGSHGRAKTQGI